jgi:hypothetical protein
MASTTVMHHRKVAAVMTAVGPAVAGAQVLRERARLPSEPARARSGALQSAMQRRSDR